MAAVVRCFRIEKKFSAIAISYPHKSQPMLYFKFEFIDHLDYHNNQHIKAKLKGLPPAFTDKNFPQKYCLTFWDHFTI